MIPACKALSHGERCNGLCCGHKPELTASFNRHCSSLAALTSEAMLQPATQAAGLDYQLHRYRAGQPTHALQAQQHGCVLRGVVGIGVRLPTGHHSVMRQQLCTLLLMILKCSADLGNQCCRLCKAVQLAAWLRLSGPSISPAANASTHMSMPGQLTAC